MAFKMRRPIIEGTKSYVEQTRTTADKSLVDAAQSLGESYVPKEIDYTLTSPKINISNRKDKVDGSKLIDKLKKLKKKKTKTEKEKEEVKVLEKVIEKTPEVDPIVEDKWVDEPVDAGEPGLEPIPESTVVEGKSDYKEPRGYKNWKRREEERLIQEAEDLKKRQDEASKARQGKVTPLDPKIDIKPIPTEDQDIKPSTAGKAPEYKDTVKADKNPKYNLPESTGDPEGRTIGGTVEQPQPGYSYTHESDQWTYNGFPITESEVPSDHVNMMMQESLNSQSESKTDTKDTTEKKEIKKPRESKYKWPSGAWKHKGEERYETDLQNWRESQSPTQMRDDRIWRNATKGGKVHENMLKSGYIPPNER
jgi:hypothetical protein